MAWNVEETKRRLRAAAVEEFAAKGLAGTRMDAIASRAGINKERLYNYFGTKEQLFSVVLADEMTQMAAAVPVESISTDGIGGYAGRCFDYHLEHPALVRLLHWEGLEFDGAVPDEKDRRAHYQLKVAALRAGQTVGSVDAHPRPSDMLFMILAISSWWAAVPHVARMVVGDPDRRGEMARRRAAVVLAAERIAGSAPASS